MSKKNRKNNSEDKIPYSPGIEDPIGPSSIMAINNFSQIQPENIKTPKSEVKEAKDWVDSNEK